MTNEPCPLTLRETARLLGVGADWLLRQAESGTLPALRTDVSFFFNLAAVRHALLLHAAGPAAEPATVPLPLAAVPSARRASPKTTPTGSAP